MDGFLHGGGRDASAARTTSEVYGNLSMDATRRIQPLLVNFVKQLGASRPTASKPKGSITIAFVQGKLTLTKRLLELKKKEAVTARNDGAGFPRRLERLQAEYARKPTLRRDYRRPVYEPSLPPPHPDFPQHAA